MLLHGRRLWRLRVTQTAAKPKPKPKPAKAKATPTKSAAAKKLLTKASAKTPAKAKSPVSLATEGLFVVGGVRGPPVHERSFVYYTSSVGAVLWILGC